MAKDIRIKKLSQFLTPREPHCAAKSFWLADLVFVVFAFVVIACVKCMTVVMKTCIRIDPLEGVDAINNYLKWTALWMFVLIKIGFIVGVCLSSWLHESFVPGVVDCVNRSLHVLLITRVVHYTCCSLNKSLIPKVLDCASSWLRELLIMRVADHASY